MQKSKQEQIEDDILKLKEKIVECEKAIEEKIKLRMKMMEYIDIPVLREIKKGDLQDKYSITTEKANDAFVGLINHYIRFWFENGNIEIVVKED